MEEQILKPEPEAAGGRRKLPRGLFIADLILIAAAVILLAASGFWRTMGAPVAFASAEDIAAFEGRVVGFSADVNYGYYAERYGLLSQKTTGKYMLSSLFDEPVSVLVPDAGLETADKVKLQTLHGLLGQKIATSARLTGTGYVRKLTDGELDRAYKWFETNKDLFDGSDIDISDAADLVGEYVIVMDHNGIVSAGTAKLLSLGGALLLVLALALPVAALLRVGQPAAETARPGEEDAEKTDPPESEGSDKPGTPEASGEPEAPSGPEGTEETDA